MVIETWENIIQTRLRADESTLNKDLLPSISSLNTIVNNIKNNWQGSDYNFFEDKMQLFLKDIDELEKSIETIHKYVKGYLDAYQALISHYESKTILLK